MICRDHLITGNTATSHTSSARFYSIGSMNCNSKNIVYLISCGTCGKQYVGQTLTTLRQRFNNHKSVITGKEEHHTKKLMNKHFNGPGHNGVADLRIQFLEQVKSDGEKEDIQARLDRAESKWLWNLGTHVSKGGLDIEEPFLHGLTITN